MIQTGVGPRQRRPRAKRDRRHDKFGLTIAFAAAAGFFALSVIAGTIARGRLDVEPTLSFGEQAAALRNGAILFVAPDGHPCRQKLIDNATWIIRDGGPVNCETALSQLTSAQRQKWSSDRAEAIRAGLAGR